MCNFLDFLGKLILSNESSCKIHGCLWSGLQFSSFWVGVVLISQFPLWTSFTASEVMYVIFVYNVAAGMLLAQNNMLKQTTDIFM